MAIRPILMSAGAVFAIAAGSPAMAQEPSEPANAVGEGSGEKEQARLFGSTIVVTAQLREQTLLDVPVPVSVVSGEVIQDGFLDTAADLQRIVPSLTIANTGDGGPADSRVRIRGVGTNVFSGTVEPSVSIVIDGVPLPRNEAGIVDFIDIQRVEVLKGPQGTLFGKNASAGVVSYTTKAPTEELEGQFRARGTLDGDYRLDGTISTGIAENLAIRLTASYNEVADYQTNVFTGNEAGGTQSLGLRGKLRFDNGPVAFELTGDYFDQESNCCALAITDFAGTNLPILAAGVTASSTNRDFSADTEPFNTNQTWGISGKFDFEAGNVVLTSITSWREWDYGGDLQDIDFFGTLNSRAVVGGTGLQQRGFQSAETFTQELRVSPLAPTDVDFVAGLFFYNNNFSRFFDRDIQLCFAPATPVGANCAAPFAINQFFTLDVRSTNIAAFGDVSYNVTDSLKLIGGLRVFVDELKFSTDTFSGFEASDRNTDTALTGRVGFQYDLSPDLTSYFTYSRGYKSGAFDVTLGVNAAALAGGAIRPEDVDAFEFGIRGGFESLPGFFFDLSLFNNSYSDFQVQAFDPEAGGTTRLINAGETVTRGGELTLSWSDDSGFSLLATAAYLDAYYGDFAGNACYFGQTAEQGCQTSPGGVRFQNSSGQRLPVAPEWKFSVLPRHEFELNSGGSIFGQVLASYQSKINFSSDGDPRTVQPGYALVDLSVGYMSPDEKLGLTLYMKNAFDQFYRGIVVANFINDPGGLSQVVPRNAERIIGAELSVQF